MSHLSWIDFFRREKMPIFFGIFVFVYILISGWIFQLDFSYFLYISMMYFLCFVCFLLFFYSKRNREYKEMMEWIHRKDYELPLKENKDPLVILIRNLDRENTHYRNEEEKKQRELREYLTIWTHQIKSPLFALRLLLKKEEINPRDCEKELFEMEEYIQNILGYVRLESDSTDYVFQVHSLDEMVRSTIRKYSIPCIGKNNRVEFSNTERKILTDSKWFVFLLEQIISNAIKYTENGTISFALEGEKLKIEDSGIGIIPEDLPRIFDPGYTGYNGRLEKKATGLGLSLAKSIGFSLRIPLEAKSEPKVGTKIYLDLSNVLQ